uniref:Uncharacterized protein n=1 Tax=Amphilophus citrinellus TaxID=61819 RepID=A0A3Q0RVG3_AMPCI
MMQISSDSVGNKHSLINVMHRFIAATNNMDETIMVPSLLRDMPLDEHQANNNEPPCSDKQRDMYDPPLSNSSTKSSQSGCKGPPPTLSLSKAEQ